MPICRGTAKRLGLKQPNLAVAEWIRAAMSVHPNGVPMCIKQGWPYYRSKQNR